MNTHFTPPGSALQDAGTYLEVLVPDLASQVTFSDRAKSKVISFIGPSDPMMTSCAFQFILNHAVLANVIPALSQEYFIF